MNHVATDDLTASISVNALSIQDNIKQLRSAQKKWSQTPLKVRAQKCRQLKRYLSEHSEEFARTISEENGKTKLEALSQEIIPTLDTLDFLQHSCESILTPKKIKLQTKQFYFKGKQNSLQYHPYGVVGILGTWNYAFFLSFTQTLFAIIAGNAVYLKSSELSPKVNQLIADLLNAGDFPKGLYVCVSADASFGRAFVSAKCDKYILTGSKKTGEAVLKVLADSSTPSVMELSGCDPYIIFPDADFDLAVQSLIWTAYQYSGQTCVAPRRLIIQKQDREKCLKLFRKHFENCSEFIESQGALRSAPQAAQEREKIQRLLDDGGEIVLGTFDSKSTSNRITPILIQGVPNQTLASMDFMAPVVFLIETDDVDGMIALASESESALGASVWTCNEALANKAIEEICAGQIWINDGFFSVAVGSVAFGGFKASGFGKTRGAAGLLEMVQEKFVSVDSRKKRMTPQLPPYQKRSFEILNGLQRILFADGIWIRCKAIGRFISQVMQSDKKR